MPVFVSTGVVTLFALFRFDEHASGTWFIQLTMRKVSCACVFICVAAFSDILGSSSLRPIGFVETVDKKHQHWRAVTLVFQYYSYRVSRWWRERIQVFCHTVYSYWVVSITKRMRKMHLSSPPMLCVPHVTKVQGGEVRANELQCRVFQGIFLHESLLQSVCFVIICVVRKMK